MTEESRVRGLSAWYLEEQLGFDKRLIRFRYETLRPHLKGPDGLELGPAEGEMTQFLLPHFDNLTVVDGSATLLAQIPEQFRVTKVHSLFESFKPLSLFNTIIMEHILEHVDSPVSLLIRAKEWLIPGGHILIGVPNANSIHRLAAVKMGMLGKPNDLNQRDLALGHRRIYTQETLRRDLASAELDVVEMGGVFLKPLSNKQIEDHWSDEMIEGFYALGKDFPQNAAEIYAIARPRWPSGRTGSVIRDPQ